MILNKWVACILFLFTALLNPILNMKKPKWGLKYWGLVGLIPPVSPLYQSCTIFKSIIITLCQYRDLINGISSMVFWVFWGCWYMGLYLR